MSAIIVAGNEIIPDTLTVTVDGTEITAKDFQKVLLNINQASATASVADGTDLMQKMEIINKNANACDVSFKGEGGATVKNLKQNQSMRLSWTGSYWYVTFGGLLSGVANDGTPFNYTTEVTLDEAPLNTTYSTTEVDTGMTWIDGKPIYRLSVIDTVAKTKVASVILDVDTTLTVPIDKVVNITGLYSLDGQSIRSINGTQTNAGGTTVYISTWASYTFSTKVLKLSFDGTSAFTIDYIYVTIYYTKTTD